MTADRKKVLVLGGRGRLGRLLFRVWGAVGTSSFPVIWHSRRSPIDDSGDWVAWDLLKQGPPTCLKGGINTVLNLVGVVPGGKQDLSLNRELALAATEAARVLGARHIFHLSSAAVYGDGKFGWHEGVELYPVSEYGRAKLDMERAILSLTSSANPSEPRQVLLRLGNVVGADQLIGGAVARGAESLVQLDQFPDGLGPVRSYIGPVTLADVLQVLLQRASCVPGLPPILNVAAPVPVSMDSLLDASGAAWRWRCAGEEAIQYLRIDVSVLSGLFSFLPRHCQPDQMVREWKRLSDA
ncbi:NAD-dependent epimerase/dehydratase family protein [Shimia abyssi]|uniref:Nucleoside-diphosphate-sugar epimerase n=1 Tax=Shimia abyssi TaxID=1662395 RepID=A0A2P8F790_9RHOB|nr:NAD-dependent epimerase/dehydratase family protein [Shimia abyssi]PSL17588.1 nucleoside-diphosphate-sugar epimerase [Shimia abyssi]